ncbi:hypothetical protein [Thiofilum flexile]|uniref:hypothetical protein n=1 Tax=Thiofilum flexile TaxID=125627 RepID=UPI00037CC447|nr:hypothetical protein [Thiofilum flexile]
MKKSYALLASSILLGLITTSAQAVTLYDYREANPSYTDAQIDASFNAKTNKNKTITTTTGQKTSYDLNLNFDYERVISNPIRDIEFLSNINGSSTRASTGEKSNSYSGTASANVFNYFKPNSKGAFVYGGAKVADIKGKTGYYAAATAGVGYGRIVDATPMSQAIWIVRELRKQGKLTGDLSVTDYQNLARVIGKKDEYEARMSRVTANYEEAWVADMANVINASGKVNGQLDAAGVLRIYDVAVNDNGNFITRKIGSRVRAGIGSTIKNYTQDSSKPSAEIVGEYHRPINNDWQFSNVASLTGTVDSDENGYDLNNVMSFDRQISNKAYWKNSWTANRNKSYDQGVKTTTTSNILSTKYYYSLGNRVALSTGLEVTKSTDLKTDTTFTSGITYKLR